MNVSCRPPVGTSFPRCLHYSVMMVSYGEFLGLDFANYKVPRLAGKAVIDVDYNGVSDNDPPLADWNLELYLDDGDLLFDPAQDELVATTVTDEQGQLRIRGCGARLLLCRPSPAG